jgi:thymidylate kinase
MNLDDLAQTYRILAIDGCDGTGKTTLAEYLRARHGYTTVHSPRTPDHIELADRYRHILARVGRVVLDRCFVSELVYGPMRHGRSRLSWSDAVDLSATLAAQSGAFVHLTDEPIAIKRRLLDRGDTEHLALRDIADLVAGYEGVFDTLTAHAPVLRVRTDLVSRWTG